MTARDVDLVRSLSLICLGLVLACALVKTWDMDPYHPLGLAVAAGAIGLIVRFRPEISTALDRPMSTRSLWLLVGLAFLVRLVFAAVAQVEPVSDFKLYLDLAKTLALEGQYTVEGQPFAARTIGIPFLASVFIRVGIDPRVGMSVLNATLSAGATMPVFLWARDLGDRSGAWAAALFAAFLPSLVFGAALIGREPVFVGLVAWYWYLSSRVDAGEKARWLVVALGLLAGLSAYVRGEAILLPFASLAVAAVLGPDRRSRVLRYAAAGALTILLLVPWGLRNQSQFGEFWLLGSSSGHAAWLANNPNATGGAITEADLPEVLPKDEVARDRAGNAKAVEWVRENPGRFVRLIPMKWYYMLGSQHDAVSLTHVHSKRIRPLLSLSHALTQTAYLVVLALGLWAVWRRRGASGVRLHAALAAFGFVILPRIWYHGQPRYHAAMVPVLCLLAGLAFIRTMKAPESEVRTQ